MLAELRVDLDAVRANVAALQALVAPARLAAVVKGNAYGHGLPEIAAAVGPQADRLCVYELAEALALREAGIAGRIHVLGPIPPAHLDSAHAAGAEITLWDAGAYAADVARTARQRGKPFTVHAKVDTGVTRLGMSVGAAPALLERYRVEPEFRLASVFSHLAAAEELDFAYTRQQLAAFAAATRTVPLGIERHIAASAAAMLWPQTRFNAVRTGIAIYGIWPSPETGAVMRERGLELTPALSWLSEIVLVHEVAAGTSIGYGCTFRTPRDSRIGVLPIGYAEGLPRSASNRGFVLVGGARVPIVGRVCMNMAFVDLTDAPAARTGSAVTLIGSDGSARIDAEDAAEWAGTIAYELVTRIPAHVPRRYLASSASASRRSSVPA